MLGPRLAGPKRPGRRRTRRRRLRRRLRARLSVRTTRTRSCARTSSSSWTAWRLRRKAARNPAGSNIQVAYSLPPEGGSGFGDLVYATVPLGSVATKVARDWLANELYEPSRRGKIDAACRDRKVADLITAAGASAPADAVFGGRFATGETPRSTTSASEADEGDGAGGDGGTGFDLFGPDPTPMEDL